MTADIDNSNTKRPDKPLRRAVMSRINEHYQWTGKPKVGYARQQDANIVASKMTRDKGDYFHSYMCHCEYWHIGHLPRLPKDHRTEMLVGKLIGELRKAFKVNYHDR